MKCEILEQLIINSKCIFGFDAEDEDSLISFYNSKDDFEIYFSAQKKDNYEIVIDVFGFNQDCGFCALTPSQLHLDLMREKKRRILI